MKTFVIRVALFATILAAYLAANLALNLHYIEVGHPDLAGIRTLVLGDSMPMSAVDPGRLPNSRNIAQRGEPYVITYHKMKTLLRHNPEIDTVILGFSVHNLAAFTDWRFHGRDRPRTHFERTYLILDLDDLEGLPVDRHAYYVTLLHELMLYPKRNPHQTYMGRFHEQEPGLEKASLEKIVDKHFVWEGEPMEVSRIATEHLDRIVGLAGQSAVRLVLLVPPTHHLYREKIPEALRRHHEQTRERLEASGVIILDYSELLSEDRLFKDFDHVGGEGAGIVTARIREALERP